MGMNHISDQDWERFHLGMVAGAELNALEAHILACGECAARAGEAADYVDTMRAAIKSGTPTIPPLLAWGALRVETELMEEQVLCFDSRERRVRLPKSPGDERRACTRYPIGLDLRYTFQYGRKPLETGNGRTVDLSRSGLRFTADRPPLLGLKVSVAVRWPMSPDRGVQLQMVATGKVVWAKGNEAALKIQRHEFRTEEQD
jgi:hypothetical protein